MTQQHAPKTYVSEGRPPGIKQSDDTDEISVGNVCHVLQNERRRLTLNHLRNADEPLRTSDLAEAVAATENDTTPEQLSHSERKRVYISLYQVHLPTLDDAGVIAYNSDRGTIETLPLAHKMYEALDNLTAVTFPTDREDERERENSEAALTNPPTHTLLVASIGVVFGVLIGMGLGNVVSGTVLYSMLGPLAAAGYWFFRDGN